MTDIKKRLNMAKATMQVKQGLQPDLQPERVDLVGIFRGFGITDFTDKGNIQ